MKNFCSAFILALGIAIAGISIAYSIYSFKNFDHFVAVKGLAEQTVKSNDAIWQLRINITDDSLPSLYQQITDAQNKMSAFLTGQGFSAKEIQLMSIDVIDNAAQTYSANNNKNMKRYSATAGVVLHTALIDNLVSAQQKVSLLIQQGIVLSQSQVSFYFNKLNDIKPLMLNQATDNAKKTAELFARNSNNHLGKIRTASQGLFTIEDVAQQGYSANSSVMKNVRVVTTVEYFLS